LLNRIGIQQLNHLPVLHFGLGEFEGHFDEYTYAATFSMCPAYYADGLAALDKPLLVVLGELDTKFGGVPANVAQAVKENSRGEVVIVDGEDHHVQNSAEAIDQVSRWIAQLPAPSHESQ
jgi:pimeloyl-ACP methyl ester carboxylesterase